MSGRGGASDQLTAAMTRQLEIEGAIAGERAVAGGRAGSQAGSQEDEEDEEEEKRLADAGRSW